MRLLTGYYNDPDPALHAELRECLRRNAANELIKEIHFFNGESVVAEKLQSDSVLSLNKLRLNGPPGMDSFLANILQDYSFVPSFLSGEYSTALQSHASKRAARVMVQGVAQRNLH